MRGREREKKGWRRRRGKKKEGREAGREEAQSLPVALKPPQPGLRMTRLLAPHPCLLLRPVCVSQRLHLNEPGSMFNQLFPGPVPRGTETDCGEAGEGPGETQSY